MEFLDLEWLDNRFHIYRKNLEAELEESKQFLEENWLDFYVKPEMHLRINERETKPISLVDHVKNRETKNNFTITGEPGIGKTTFMRWAALQLCKDDLLPIHFYLGAYSGQGDLNTHLMRAVEEHDKELGKGLKQNLLSKLRSGNAVFLLDALDEASGPQTEVLGKLKDFIALYPKNYFLMSVRTNLKPSPTYMNGFSEVEMQLFTKDNISEYLDKKLTQKDAEKLKQKIKDLGLDDFCQLPLMLRFVTELKDELDEQIKNKAHLYERFLFHKFTTRERTEKERDYFGAQRKIDALAELAFTMQTDKSLIEEFGGKKIRYDLTQKFLEDQIKGEPKLKLDFFHEIWNNGLLVERGDHCQFLHLTIQEYLVARAVKNKLDSKEFTIPEFVDKYVRQESDIYAG